MHPVWRILARASGRKEVGPGDFVWADLDFVYLNDANSYFLLQRFREYGVRRVWDPERVVLVYDHHVPPVDEYTALHAQATRSFAKEVGLRHVFAPGAGISHEVMIENGFVRPGLFIHGGDSHSPTIGALGLLSVGGNSDLICSAVTGRLWMRVPEILKIRLSGRLSPGVSSYDLILHIVSRDHGFESRLVEFSGSAVEAMDIDDRLTLTNMAVDTGVESAYIFPDEKVARFLEGRPVPGPPGEFPRERPGDSAYTGVVEIDAGQVPPYVARPHSHNTGVPVGEVAGTPIDQAVIGSCGGGKLEDLRRAAEILRGRKVHPSVRMVVAPASREALAAAMREGIIQTIVAAGAQLDIVGCGACIGYKHVLAPGERCITSTTRNHKGRMGSPEAEVYLGSPASVAAAAVAGEIADPRGL